MIPGGGCEACGVGRMVRNSEGRPRLVCDACGASVEWGVSPAAGPLAEARAKVQQARRVKDPENPKGYR